MSQLSLSVHCDKRKEKDRLFVGAGRSRLLYEPALSLCAALTIVRSRSSAGVGRFGTEKAQEPLRRANAAGNHLLSLINEVLDLSKIEAGKLELNPELVDLDEVIGTAGQLAEKNQNRLVVEAQEHLGPLNADSMRDLRQRVMISRAKLGGA